MAKKTNITHILATKINSLFLKTKKNNKKIVFLSKNNNKKMN